MKYLKSIFESNQDNLIEKIENVFLDFYDLAEHDPNLIQTYTATYDENDQGFIIFSISTSILNIKERYSITGEEINRLFGLPLRRLSSYGLEFCFLELRPNGRVGAVVNLYLLPKSSEEKNLENSLFWDSEKSSSKFPYRKWAFRTPQYSEIKNFVSSELGLELVDVLSYFDYDASRTLLGKPSGSKLALLVKGLPELVEAKANSYFLGRGILGEKKGILRNYAKELKLSAGPIKLSYHGAHTIPKEFNYISNNTRVTCILLESA